MRTIECVFVSNKEVPLKSARNHKRYTFNTYEELLPGDVLILQGYSQPIMVVSILKELMYYYNAKDKVKVPIKILNSHNLYKENEIPYRLIKTKTK